MESALKTWYGLFGMLMKKRDMTLDEAVKWCEPFTDTKVAYEEFDKIK